MNINIRNRFIVFGVVFFGLFVVLFIQLTKLTLVKGAEYRAAAEELREETITISGARGSILDRNGLPLAYDQKSYNVQFLRDPQKNTATDKANYTRIIMDTVEIIEANGGKPIDTFAIKYDQGKDVFYFDWGDIRDSAKERREENWRKNMYVSTEKKVEAEGLATLKSLLDSELLGKAVREKLEGSSILSYVEEEPSEPTASIEEESSEPTASIEEESSEPTASIEEESSESTESIEEGPSESPASIKDYGYNMTPEEIYLLLRDRYQIPAEMGYEEARKLLSIWQDVQLSSWAAYKPVTIAYNVNIQTVAQIETHAVELSGMSVDESTTRIYPRGTLAAHIIGYTGRITGEIIDAYSISEDTEKGLKALKNLADSELLGEAVREQLSGSSILSYIDTAAVTSKNSLTEFGYTEQELNGIKGLLDLGYSVDGRIGIQGVEKTMEAYLTGDIKKRQGVQNVQVDKTLKIVKNVLSSTEPEQGDNTVLTIDVPFQQAVERSLEENIPLIRQEQIAQYEKYKDVESSNLGTKAYKGIDLEKIKLAESGAAVVLDVNTGDVLATASYPSYDPNLFIQGMTQEQFVALGFKDKELAPLLNRAVSSRGTPGSIFKMVTGLGALMEGQKDPAKGTTLTEKIDDEGLFDKYTKDNPKDSPKCGVYPAIWKHQDQTIVEGLEHSCNYYFYTLADRLGISKLNEWGEKFGLTAPTGIELPGELTGQIGGQRILFNPDKPINRQASYLPLLVKEGKDFGIVKILKDFAQERGLNYDDKEIDAAAEELVYLMGIEWKTGKDNVLVDERGVAMGNHIRSVLSKSLNISTRISRASGLDTAISSMLSQLMWTPINTVMTGIGQGYVQVTPIAIARYVAAVVNGGTVYEAHIVDKIIDQSGEVVIEKDPVVYGTLNAPQEFLDKIKQGMGDVVNAEDGTAAKYFRDFEYKDDIGGKTGTAEVSDIDLENNSWFVCFAPYDKPKIAVVVYVPHGLSGGLSSYIAQDIVEFYLEREAMIAEQTIPVSDSLVGK